MPSVKSTPCGTGREAAGRLDRRAGVTKAIMMDKRLGSMLQ